MDLTLKGRRALIAGSSSGRGVAIAPMLAAEGAVSSARERKGSGVTPNRVSPGAIRAPAVEEALRQAATLLGWGEARQDIQAGSVCDLGP